MEITGKIIAVLPERSGTSSRSGAEWRCGSYVLETMEQYPRKMNFEVFGADRIQQFNIKLGETYTVSFDIDAREYQGRWFNSIRAWKVEAPVAGAPIVGDSAAAPMGGSYASAAPFPPASNAPAAAAPSPMASPASDPFGGGSDDLPF